MACILIVLAAVPGVAQPPAPPLPPPSIQPDAHAPAPVAAQPSTATQVRIDLTVKPATPAKLIPPLSIYESRLILDDAVRKLAPGTPETLPVRVQQVQNLLDAVTRYVEWVDRSHPTLPYYKWVPIDDAKLRYTNWRTFMLKPDNTIPKVTALSISAHHGDVTVEQLIVVGANREQWEFNREIQVRADQPRSEICYLPLATNLTEVQVRCRKTDPADRDRPRLFISAGICSRPEAGKQTVYYLQRAQYHLKQDEVDEARKMLGVAAELLHDYQVDRRL